MLRTRLLFVAVLVFTLSLSSLAAAQEDMGKSVYVRLDTSEGPIVLELWPDKAPKTVRNFLKYVVSDFYVGTVFHRVIPGFMIQGGGLTEKLIEKSTLPAIENEADNGLKNRKYTVAMARTNDPHSATSQFFINVKDNDFLDYKAPTMKGWGYCVFGRVAAGKGVVDKIERVKTARANSIHTDVPVKPVSIIRTGMIDN